MLEIKKIHKKPFELSLAICQEDFSGEPEFTMISIMLNFNTYR